LEARADTAIMDDGPVRTDSRDDIPDPKYITYVDYQNPFALVDGCSGAPHVAKLSPNAWVGCGNDIYILECLGKGYIRIESVPADEG
jgi:ATP-dependent helicase IRC3